ncbi:MAG: YHS domain-containing protein, partial [Candidatus Hydrogenedentes bacterium]|nr:YHS domain-containing protein [Candidatus Hydrogenedentota bacterium]
MEASFNDPVCGMPVDGDDTSIHLEHAGATYYFCSEGCQKKFDADPAQYVSKDASPAIIEEVNDDSREYVCPMHPEVVAPGPGACPKCGMALESREISVDDGANPEYEDMRRRFLVSAVLTAPVFLYAMAEMLFGKSLSLYVAPQVPGWIQFALATPVVLWGGWPFFQRGWQSLVTRNLNMFTLIGLGTGAAYMYSVAAILAPGLFPPSF